MRDPMVGRTIKVPRDLWDAVKAKADERGENISEVIRRELDRYLKRKDAPARSRHDLTGTARCLDCGASLVRDGLGAYVLRHAEDCPSR